MRNERLVKTPELKLAVGEPVLLQDGSVGLKIKRGKTYDTISLEDLKNECTTGLNK